MRPLVAHCHFGLGRLFRETGHREQAKQYITSATELYRELELPYWLEQADAQKCQLEVIDPVDSGRRHPAAVRSTADVDGSTAKS